MSTMIMFFLCLRRIIPLLRFIVLVSVRCFDIMVGIIAGMIG